MKYSSFENLQTTKEVYPHVHSFWVLTNGDAPCEIQILPDDCVDIVFDIENNNAFVCGLMTKKNCAKLKENTNLLGVRVKTENFGLLTKIPLFEIKNSAVDFSELGVCMEADIQKKLGQKATVNEKLAALGSFVVALQNDGYEQKDTLIEFLAEHIRSKRGNVCVRSFAKEYHLSTRQIQRRFKRSMGLTVKEFSSIVRFNYAVEAINKSNDKCLLDIAYDLGFYDHSHLTQEFNKITGYSPSFFRSCRFSTKRVFV